MTAEDSRFAIERVVIALGSACDVSRQIEAAADLADRLHAELRGVFVEDANLLKAADLPFTRQVALARDCIRPLERSVVEAEFRALANRARRYMERIAGSRRIAWSFDIVRGDRASQTPKAEPNELVVMETRSRAFAGRVRLPIPGLSAADEGLGARAFLGVGLATSRKIAVVLDGSRAAGRALDMALDLAGNDPGSLAVFLTPGSGEKMAGREVRRAGLRAARTLQDATPTTLRQVLRSEAVGIAVLPVSFAGGPAKLEDLIADSPCTILLVG
jgi:hypothetical protein